ncbi:MAG: ligase-associated DNA damage response exonuclease [Acidobacteria bacterium]|nr:ligase-associated DNA damage response exonuclease [Acidobacteriota bacterium]
MKRDSLITLTAAGLFCRQGGFYIDPWRPVDRAVVTHAHSDHAYRGSKHYLVTKEGEELARIRLDPEATISTLPYGRKKDINGVKVSFHPAGHILGSAQVRVEYRGEVWVVSGDYKLTPDPTCAPFEHVRCHNFITEATFGLPIYRWPPPEQVFGEISGWWRRNQEKGKASVIFAYSLGKAQRVLAGIDRSIGRIYTHGSVERLTQAYRRAGVDLAPTTYAGGVANKKEFVGSLIVGPPSAQATTWLRRFGTHSTGFASGWMLVRGARRQRAIDRGFVLSDHADWPELQTAIKETNAETVYVTHGFSEEVVRWLNENGMNAVPLKTQFVGDDAPELLDEESEGMAAPVLTEEGGKPLPKWKV